MADIAIKSGRPWCASCSFGVWQAFILVSLGVSLGGCGATQEITKTARNPVEQLLITQSVERGLSTAPPVVPPKGAVVVEAAGLTDDQKFAREIVVEWLRQQGWQVNAKEAPYLVHLRVYALGTQQSQSFFGIPATQGTLIPLSIPELAVYKAQRQHGYARFAFTVIETSGGRVITSSPMMEGDVYFNQYTLLFAFTFARTNLVPPPE